MLLFSIDAIKTFFFFLFLLIQLQRGSVVCQQNARRRILALIPSLRARWVSICGNNENTALAGLIFRKSHRFISLVFKAELRVAAPAPFVGITSYDVKAGFLFGLQ